MAYYVEERPGGPALAPRRPTINEFFLSTYQVGPYVGCEFGCAYCDGWSFSQRPFNEVIRANVDLPDRFAEQLSVVSRGDLIAFSLGDAYQPAEKTYRLTRQMLQACQVAKQPVLILTKSLAVMDDLSLLQRMNEQGLAIVVMSIPTIDPLLSEKLEGKVAPPSARLEALNTLKRAGIPTGVAMLPVIPYLTDTDRQLPLTLNAIANVQPDFVVWEYLWQPNERHRQRITDLLSRLGNYPASYYRELYGKDMQPSLEYRREMHRDILGRFEELNLNPRAPLELYREHLAPNNVAALMLKHQAFIDQIKGRELLASRHSNLAEAVFNGKADEPALAVSPLWPMLREVLNISDSRARLDQILEKVRSPDTPSDPSNE